MKMVHALTTIPTIIDNQTIAVIGEALLFRHLCSDEQQVPEQLKSRVDSVANAHESGSYFFVRGGNGGELGNWLLRYHEKMRRRLFTDIVKCHALDRRSCTSIFEMKKAT